MNNQQTLSAHIFRSKEFSQELVKSLEDRKVIDNIRNKAIIADSKELTYNIKNIQEQLDSGSFDFTPIEEALILTVGRPVLEVIGDTVSEDEPELDYWKSIIKSNKGDDLTQTFKAIGRIELSNHPTYDWIGTGWLYKDDLIITNRHVASVFAKKVASGFSIKKNIFGEPYKVSIDFKEEYGDSTSSSHELVKVVHIEPDSGPDIAVLQIKWTNNNHKRKPLELADYALNDKTVATIGYPARDSRTSIPEDQLRVFSNIFDKKRFAVGEIDWVEASKEMFIHDCSTLGGNSGSPVIDIESKKVYGLHFAGRERVGNYAITSDTVSKILRGIRLRTNIYFPDLRSEDAQSLSVEDLDGRNGYNESFLNKNIPLPKLSHQLELEVAEVSGRDDGELKYTNYSVVMSAEKRLALLTAVNIDGAKWRHVYRGRDVWRLDPRISQEHQVGNELYKRNDLDRGHLVRRLDPAWGKSFSDAKFASLDTFFYTNCAPQHKNLNQKTWLGLEEYILSNTDEKNMKVSVFNGPVFAEDDTIYRGIQIPDSFWKVVVANHANGEIRTSAYLLSQGKWLSDLEYTFGQYKTFQVTVAHIQELTKINFGDLVVQSDVFSGSENPFGNLNEVKQLEDIQL